MRGTAGRSEDQQGEAPSFEGGLTALLSGRDGHFLLESGHHGDLWLDLDALFLRPARLSPFVDELAGRFFGHGVVAVCGPLTGGAFVAQAVAATLDARFFYADRLAGPAGVEYRIPAGLRPHLSGCRVAVVDDVLNAGSAVRGTVTDVRRCDALPVAIGALVVLGNPASALASEMGVALERIARLESHLWAPGDCPLCASGAVLEALVR
jgi:orotate phosphoribosyltransferase